MTYILIVQSIVILPKIKGKSERRRHWKSLKSYAKEKPKRSDQDIQRARESYSTISYYENLSTRSRSGSPPATIVTKNEIVSPSSRLPFQDYVTRITIRFV
ncbi:hypothetical protein I7I51_05475 [Histoplasma capsulatum]|uniref:Uncharacterized protein n=1 Tax=Ajellomyces capsulatus TaxID=5037 RepID=A0A8A1M7U5_AJECA|nr:predicted protein [Histoplasma mississippiense (nom. inval.)]EDN03646.1 predicted protein [Histoplasma mississippiense (nom. inval.)]QSS60674.1 hypothetical protein I7I51_05475 [Histoplasma capsulatum]